MNATLPEISSSARKTMAVPTAHSGCGKSAKATGTTSGGKLDLSFELVRHVAKMETPLVELGSNAAIITTIADVTFYGRDQVGNDVTVSGTMQIDFGNFGDK